MFSINIGKNKKRETIKTNEYNTKKANWDKFGELIENEFKEEYLHKLKTQRPDKAAKFLNNKLNKICKKTIPKKNNK